MTQHSKVDVVCASNIIDDTFLAEFSCGEDTWGHLAFNPEATNYAEAYTLTLYGSIPSEPFTVSVAELEQALQIAKWRVTPIRPEPE